MVTLRLSVALAVAGCGTIEPPPIDATAADSAPDAYDGAAPHDGPIYQDVTPFDGYAPPLENEFPPPCGIPCDFCGSCGVPGAVCDLGTGWCCSNDGKDGRCVCGQEPGCQPPAVCCPLTGQQDYKCVPTANDCPAYAPKDQ